MSAVRATAGYALGGIGVSPCGIGRDGLGGHVE